MTLNKFGYSTKTTGSGMNLDEVDLLKRLEEECMTKGIDFDSFLTKASNLRRR